MGDLAFQDSGYVVREICRLKIYWGETCDGWVLRCWLVDARNLVQNKGQSCTIGGVPMDKQVEIGECSSGEEQQRHKKADAAASPFLCLINEMWLRRLLMIGM
ncbi:MAG: hypothetical protein R2867_13245 [Caldilineaceae bacterium]